MTFATLQQTVIDPELCTSCGACAAVCPAGIIGISADQPIPALTATDLSACATCTMCTDVCPGRDTGVPASEQRIFGRGRLGSERWTGIVGHTFTAQARRDDVLDAASAGGAATSILLSALERGEIDAALVIGRDEERPWVPQAKLARTAEEIIACAQASYCLTPNLQLLAASPDLRVGVVGLACQIEAIERMRNLPDPPPAADRVVFTIEIACASNTRREGTEHLIENRLQLPLVEVTSMKYRAGTYPGEFTVRDRSGAEHALPFHELVQEFKAFKTYRCLSCPDWWSGLADISIADGDPNIFRTSRNVTSQDKTSAMITRTDRGEALVRAAADSGLLHLIDATFIPEASLGLQRKRHRYATYAARHPGQVPNPPVPGEEVQTPLGDDDLIESMSRR